MAVAVENNSDDKDNKNLTLVALTQNGSWPLTPDLVMPSGSESAPAGH